METRCCETIKLLPRLFAKNIEAIKKYREFYLVMEEGEIRMGEPAKISDSAREMTSKGLLDTKSKLREEILRLKERYLFKVIMYLCGVSFGDVGSGAGEYGTEKNRLFSCFDISIRLPRLFCMVNEGDDLIVEQVG